ncbi:MAG: hypothetical protein H7239_10035 [Flavobacterium sp.]|nr:hypothetical protein [Flavobacterium sp.]
MKKYLVLILFVILFSCRSKKPVTNPNNSNTNIENPIPYKRFVITTKNEVEPEKLKKAIELGKRLLETCNTSRFKSFNSSEATQTVIENATSEKISKTCQKINFRNGKFLDLILLDITHDIETNDYIFRFDIKYVKTFYQRELKIVMNKDNKVSSIVSKEVTKKPF